MRYMGHTFSPRIAACTAGNRTEMRERESIEREREREQESESKRGGERESESECVKERVGQQKQLS